MINVTETSVVNFQFDVSYIQRTSIPVCKRAWEHETRIDRTLLEKTAFKSSRVLFDLNGSWMYSVSKWFCNVSWKWYNRDNESRETAKKKEVNVTTFISFSHIQGEKTYAIPKYDSKLTFSKKIHDIFRMKQIWRMCWNCRFVHFHAA